MIKAFSTPINIGVFGDSISKGIILRPENGKYETLRLSLTDLLGVDNVSLHNFSIMGSTVTKGLSVVERHLDELSGFKQIFLMFGGNDCDFDWQEIAIDPDKAHLPKTPVPEFKNLYSTIIDTIRGNGGTPFVLTLPPLVPERYFDWVSRKNDDHGKSNILKWLGGNVDSIYRWQEMYSMKACQVALDKKVPLLDIRSAFLMNHNYRDLLCDDGIHPNAKGHELIYRTISEQL